MAPTRETQGLEGTNILVVEDEAIVALDLVLTIEDEGASVEGPVHCLDQALAIDALDTVDAAILDVDLDGREVFAFADRLAEHEIPMVFHTGRGDVTLLRMRYPSARVVHKPSPSAQIVRALSRALVESQLKTQAAAS